VVINMCSYNQGLNVVVSGAEFVGTTEYPTLWAMCLINW